MAGHSKFSNIKRKKEKNDSKKGKVFTQIGKEIAISVKIAGADPSANARLREAIAKAKANNMPSDTIERSIKKASGNINAVNFEEIVYEGYGPQGVAVIVEVLTDNKNRAAANVRSAFTKGAGNLGNSGCVSFMFDRLGVIMIEKTADSSEEKLMDIAMNADCSDFISSIDGFEIQCLPENFEKLRTAFEDAKIEMISADVSAVPQNYVKLEDKEDIKKMNKLLDLLDDDDDVKEVFHNWDEEED